MSNITVYAVYSNMKASAIYESENGGISKANNSDSCYDLYATDTVSIPPGEARLVPLGVRFGMPEGVEARLYCRSSFPLKYPGLFVPNGVGVIDNGYTGEIRLIVGNYGNDTVTVNSGDKIAQIEFIHHNKKPSVVLSRSKFEELLEKSDRKDGGFGSSGGYSDAESDDTVITIKDLKLKIRDMMLKKQCDADVGRLANLIFDICCNESLTISDRDAAGILFEIQNLTSRFSYVR